MAVKVAPASYKQAPCLRLENEALRLLVLPGRGGNIASLFDKRAGRELLYQRPGDTLRPVPRGLCFEDAECAGIDDMFPNAAAVTVEAADGRRVRLPDHGAVWYRALSARRTEDGVSLQYRSRRFPCYFEKHIRLNGSEVRMDYLVRHAGGPEFPFLWAAHPLFRAEPGMEVLLPGGAAKADIACAEGFVPSRVREAPLRSLPLEGGGTLDLTRMPPAGMGCKYVLSRTVSKGWCALWAPKSRYAVEITFPPDRLPFLGIWMDTRADGPEEWQIAPEPSTQRSILLTERSAEDTGWAGNGRQFSWWISFRAGHAHGAAPGGRGIRFTQV